MEETVFRVAVLYADVSGSTRLYEKFGDTIARADVHACLDLLTEAAARWNGKVIKTIGDEIMCQFPNGTKAAEAAMEMQQDLAEASDDGRFQSGAMRIKIGWHYGPAEWRKGDLVGEAPVTAQQVIKLAKANEILTTAASVQSLPAVLQDRCHVIDRINSEAGLGPLDVLVQQWEETEEVTKMGGGGDADVTASRNVLLLRQGDQEFRLDSRHPACRIGRGNDCDLIVHGRFVSRLHAEVLFRHGNFHFRDQSANGSVIEFSDGRHAQLHREEGMLTGTGRIGFGGAPDEDPAAAVSFQILQQ